MDKILSFLGTVLVICVWAGLVYFIIILSLLPFIWLYCYVTDNIIEEWQLCDYDMKKPSALVYFLACLFVIIIGCFVLSEVIIFVRDTIVHGVIPVEIFLLYPVGIIFAVILILSEYSKLNKLYNMIQERKKLNKNERRRLNRKRKQMDTFLNAAQTKIG